MKDEGVSLFKMEVDNLFKTKIQGELESRYAHVNYTCTNTELTIETGDRYYTGIGISVKVGNFDFYKRKRRYEEDKIYHWYRGGLKTLRGDRNCDSIEEYDWLVETVIHPIQRTVMLMDERGDARKVLIEQDIKKATGVTQAEYLDSLRVIEAFVKEVEEVFHYYSRLETNEYFSLPHYKTGITAIVTFTDGEELLILKCKAGDSTVTVVEDTGLESERIIEVGKQAVKTRGFTKYNKKRLREV